VANLTEVAGTLNFQNDANPSFTPNGGTFIIDGTGTMNVDGGTPTINGSLVNNGNMGFGGGLLTVTGNLTNNGVAMQTEGAFSTANIQGNLTNNGAFSVGDGNINTGKRQLLQRRRSHPDPGRLGQRDRPDSQPGYRQCRRH
jgi:hypothetical protein